MQGIPPAPPAASAPARTALPQVPLPCPRPVMPALAVVLSLLAHGVITGLVCAAVYSFVPRVPTPDTVLQIGLVHATAPTPAGTSGASPSPAAPDNTATPRPATTPATVQPTPPAAPRVAPPPPPRPRNAHSRRARENTPSRATAAGKTPAAASATPTGGTQNATVQGSNGSGDTFRPAAPLGQGVNAPPAYPELARQRGQEGTCTLLAHIDAQGTPADVQVRESSGHRLLDDAALKAVRRWKFTPATRGGQRVPAQVLVPVTFRLR